ncbi:MAG: hypothetical protein DUD32_10035 [Lactobacillus sp.]|nr:MAG: hypothetical protein DUD32_10035 [Lactobacillus sp.]
MTPEFRAWNGQEFDYCTLRARNGFSPQENGIWYDLIQTHPEGIIFGTLEIKGEEEIEQYTGLKDKNGNKIYEGDIVHCENDYQGTDYTGKVMFFNGGFCVWTGGFRNYVWDDMIPEIIGNIHENPELLEVDE